jgi:hypothetical protein
MVDFFKKLVSKRYVTPHACGHNKATLYHVHHVELYEAIGQAHARFRRRMALGRAVERLMILDQVIAHRQTTWLGAEDDKVSHFLTSASLDRDQLPRLVFGKNGDTTTRFFPTNCRSASRPTRDHACCSTCSTISRRTTFVRFCAGMRSYSEPCRSGPSGCSTHPPWRSARASIAGPFARNSRVPYRRRWPTNCGGSVATERPPGRTTARVCSGPAGRSVLHGSWRFDGRGCWTETKRLTWRCRRVGRTRLPAETGRLECHGVSRQYLHLSSLVGTA